MYIGKKKQQLRTNYPNTEEKFPTCPPYWLLPDEDESCKK